MSSEQRERMKMKGVMKNESNKSNCMKRIFEAGAHSSHNRKIFFQSLSFPISSVGIFKYDFSEQTKMIVLLLRTFRK